MCLLYWDLHQTFILNIKFSIGVTSFSECFFCVSISFVGNLYVYSTGGRESIQDTVIFSCNIVTKRSMRFQTAAVLCTRRQKTFVLLYTLLQLFLLISSILSSVFCLLTVLTFVFVLWPTAFHLNPRIYFIVLLLQALQSPLSCNIVKTLTCYLSHTLMSANCSPSPVPQHPATVFKFHSFLATQKT